MKILTNISLKPFNTFHIDVNAKYFAEVASTEELLQLLSSDKYFTENKLFLGSGSNILFTKDFDGLVIKLKISEIKIISENNENAFVQAGSGVEWDGFVKYCVDKGFGGVENLSLIPGTVGAAPIQNIGAYGVEIKEIIESVTFIKLDTLKKVTLYGKDCNFGYRESIFKNELKNNFAIVSVLFRLNKNPQPNLEYSALREYSDKQNNGKLSLNDIRKTVISIRKTKLPDPNQIGNAGSFFKNPIITENKFQEIKKKFPELKGYPNGKNKIKISAGWLIEKCGLKGKRIGDVGIHPKQALVIVNYGTATGEEILNFSETVKQKVKSEFDIKLINEVNII